MTLNHLYASDSNVHHSTLDIDSFSSVFQVINYEHTLHIPVEATLSPAAANLIQRVCTGPDERLGSKGADQIKAHMFFSEITDFGYLRKQPALYKPTIRNPTDTSNFDPIDPEKLLPNGIPRKEGTLENGKNPDHAFYEFTFRRFFDNDTGNAYAQRIEDPETNNPVYV
jgi:serine/threonine-protein kinase LATS1/2